MLDMDAVLFFPPQWPSEAPYLSVPLLAGQLRTKGITCSIFDLNIDFYNDFLSKNSLLSALEKAENFVNSNEILYSKLQTANFQTLSIDEKVILLKYKEITEKFTKHKNKIIKTVNFIDEAVQILKSEKFYNPDMHYKALTVIDSALEIIMLPYYPVEIKGGEYKSSFFNFSCRDIMYQCTHKSVNIFYDYIREKLKDKFNNKRSLFGISIIYQSQLAGALTLARYLKEEKGGKVLLGGPCVTAIEETFVQKPELFDTYCDFLLLGNSEESIIELINALNSGSSPDNVSNLMYKNQEGRAVKTKSIQSSDTLNRAASASFEGLDKKNYYAPEMVINMELSKGCSWGKCTFCSLAYGQKYRCRSPRNIIEDINYYKQNYGIKYFRFCDDFIPAGFFRKLAEKFIENNLNIKFEAYARFEDEYTPELFELMYKAGCISLRWGFESASKRVLKVINKGNENVNRLKNLKDADNAGIANTILCMCGIPSETFDEALETFEFIKENMNCIFKYSLNRFYLPKKSILMDNPEKYGLSNVSCDEGFNEYCRFENNIIPEDKIKEIELLYMNNFIKDTNGNIKFLYTLSMDSIVLYLAEYGKDFVKNYEFACAHNSKSKRQQDKPAAV